MHHLYYIPHPHMLLQALIEANAEHLQGIPIGIDAIQVKIHKQAMNNILKIATSFASDYVFVKLTPMLWIIDQLFNNHHSRLGCTLQVWKYHAL